MRRASVAAAVVAVLLGTSVLGATLFASHSGSNVTRSLVYEKAGTGTIWRANVDGSHPVRLASGTNPRISPDGRFVAFFRNVKNQNVRSHGPVFSNEREEPSGLTHHGSGVSNWPRYGAIPPYAFVCVIPTRGGRAKKIARFRANPNLVWAPDSRRLAIGSETALNVIDSRSGSRTRVARRGGAFESHGLSYSPSFSPNSRSLVYKFSDLGVDDLYVMDLKSGDKRRITRLGDADNPVWGPSGIAFSHKRGIWSIGGDGRQLRRLARRQLADMSAAPLQWSADDERLLLSIAGFRPDWRFRVIDVAVGQVRLSGAGSPLGISRDGKTVLIDICLGPLSSLGSLSSPGGVMTASLNGGKPRTIVKDACLASWNA